MIAGDEATAEGFYSLGVAIEDVGIINLMFDEKMLPLQRRKAALVDTLWTKDAA